MLKKITFVFVCFAFYALSARAVSIANINCYEGKLYNSTYIAWHNAVVRSHHDFFSKLSLPLHGYNQLKVPSSSGLVWQDAAAFSAQYTPLTSVGAKETLSTMLFFPASQPDYQPQKLSERGARLVKASNNQEKQTLADDWVSVASAVFGWVPSDLERVMKSVLFDVNSHLFVIYNGEGAAAASTIVYEFDECVGVFFLGVVPKYQKQGLATLLIKEIVDLFRFKSELGVVLTATPQAKSLYKKIGFIDLGGMALY